MTLQRFSIGCPFTTTKAIYVANHKRRKQRNEPIRIGSNGMQPTLKVGPKNFPILPFKVAKCFRDSTVSKSFLGVFRVNMWLRSPYKYSGM